MASQMRVLFPAKASGYSFEVFSLLTLERYLGYRILNRQFNIRLPSGKWVQFDGLIEKDGKRLALEARFTRNIPGIEDIKVRLRQALSCGYDGLVLTSQKEVMGAESDRDIIHISLPDMLGAIEREIGIMEEGWYINAHIERVSINRESIKTEYAHINTRTISNKWREPIHSESGATLISDIYEKWVRRAGILRGEFKLEQADVPIIRSVDGGFKGGIDYLWHIEDVMSGMANLNMETLIATGTVIARGIVKPYEVAICLKDSGYRIGLSGVRDIMKMLDKLGILRMSQKEVSLTELGRDVFEGSVRTELLRSVISGWRPVKFISGIIDRVGLQVDSIMREVETIYNGLFPFARNTFNKNRTRMLINLVEFSKKSEESL
ncbi:MAG: hypothetical protein DRH49_00960 [Candidatus Coatesbacteria bacterium]|nr:MAG: hypothetical protein DRH49_00960 [Candidatus Coatesbacteria bacterium]